MVSPSLALPYPGRHTVDVSVISPGSSGCLYPSKRSFLERTHYCDVPRTRYAPHAGSWRCRQRVTCRSLCAPASASTRRRWIPASPTSQSRVLFSITLLLISIKTMPRHDASQRYSIASRWYSTRSARASPQAEAGALGAIAGRPLARVCA